MKRVLLTLLMLGSLTLMAQEQGAKNYVETRGSHTIIVEPNLFTVGITLSEADLKSRISIEEQRRELFKGLKELGIDTKEDLELSSMGSEAYKRRDSHTVISYQLTVRSIEALEGLFSLLDQIQVSNAQIIKATHDNLDTIFTEARVEAIKSAKRKAEELAGAISQSIGGAIYINDYNDDKLPSHMTRKVTLHFAEAGGVNGAMADSAMEAGSDEVSKFRSIEFEYSLTARFELLK